MIYNIQPMKYEWLLFDLDGTLLDFKKAEAKALAATFAEFDEPSNGRIIEQYHQVNSQIWLEFEQGLISQDALRVQRFARLFSKLGTADDPQAFSARYERHLGQGKDLIPGAVNLLQDLHGRCSMLLITNGIEDVQRPRLHGSIIEPFFQHIIVSGEVGVAKPAPEIFDAAFEAMGWPQKERCLIIGDSLSSDIRGGRDYGIDTCWFNPQGKTADPQIRPTYEIRRLDQLVELLTRK